MTPVSFYTTAGCHLCELAHEMLLEVQQQQDLEITAVDIADSDDLIERYGIRIPVIRLTAEDREIGWPFSLSELAAFLNPTMHP